MLRRAAAAAAVLLAAGLAPATPAYADTGRGGGVCDNSGLLVTVCAHETSTTPGTTGGEAEPAHATKSGKKTAEAPCTYARADPQPPAANLAWEDHTPKDGALYQVECPDTGRAGIVFVPNGTAGPAAPAIDPETVARQAVASMRLEGPAVASPRAAGRYPVGAPMWMWVRRTPTAYGPQTATATAGGVTVSATAKVRSIRWDMGDGNTITCLGPGTPYDRQLPNVDCQPMVARIGQVWNSDGRRSHRDHPALRPPPGEQSDSCPLPGKTDSPAT
ncbi:ATP/GTP-binding protein [Streptomyces sp. NPDC127037]|uniref:ATP/GTP-binding protein n=1 Tax=Streptomyces sp. NPDC127037 TaxID=3347113 RepID=UPI003668F576